MKWQFTLNRKGFISTYFLAILLYVTSLITIITLIERENIQTIINMKEANSYLKEEIMILNDVKCKLLNETLEDTYYFVEDISYSCEVEDTLIYITTEKEEMIISYDQTNKIVLDYETLRE